VEKFKQQDTTQLLLLLLDTRAHESHPFRVSHNPPATVTLFLFCVTYALRKKKQLSIKHITQHVRKRWQYSVRRLVFVLLLRINKTSSVNIKAIMRCVLVTIVVWKKNSKYYVLCVSTALFIQLAMRMRRFILSCYSCLLCHIFSTLSHERHDFREKIY